MIPTISSSLPGNQNFTTIKNDASNSHFLLPTSNVCRPIRRREQAKRIQNYSRSRCADFQRVNYFFDRPFLFIKKQTNILAPHPGRFYLQTRTDMNTESNVQEYCRYRDANHQMSMKVGLFSYRLNDRICSIF
jgi:hypothetical protein